MALPEAFYCGAQYYRKPNPPEGTHREHLTRIHDDLGFNIVRIWAMWNYVEPVPGKYDFAEIDEILGLCDELGLDVVVQTCLEDAPYWVEVAHPETRYVNARGVPQELSGNDNHPAGGHPGVCLDNGVARQLAERFLRATVAESKNHRCVAGYDCWNEPHIEPNWNTDYSATSADLLFCYCPSSIGLFRKWLVNKYRNIAALNVAWKRCYSAWEQVNPPRRHGNFADWLDWYRFWFDNLEAQQRWRYEVIRSEDPKRWVMSHSGGVPPLLSRIEAGINNFSLAKPVDMWGTSMAPLYQNWTTAETAACCDLTRSAAREKPFWISEMQAGSAHYRGLQRTPIPQPCHIRSTNWIGVAGGAKAIVYWCYLSEQTGNEAPGYGLVRFNGEITPRAQEAARTGRIIREFEHIVMGHTPNTDVAILYDPDSSVLLFAQEGTDRWASQSHTAYYRAVWNRDCWAHWVTPDDLASVTEPVLIVPVHFLLSEQTAEALRAYVERGGVLIGETNLGLFSEDGMQQPQAPSHGLAEVFGVEEGESYVTWPGLQSPVNQPFGGAWRGEEYQGPAIQVEKPVLAKFRAHGFFTPLWAANAEPIGWSGDHLLAVSSKYGKGTTYYFGTCLGLSMYHGETGASQLIETIIGEHTSPAVRGNDLRPRIIETEDEALLCVFNNSRRLTHKEAIHIPERFEKAVDVYTRVEVALTQHTVTVGVEPEDVAVIHLTR